MFLNIKKPVATLVAVTSATLTALSELPTLESSPILHEPHCNGTASESMLPMSSCNTNMATVVVVCFLAAAGISAAGCCGYVLMRNTCFRKPPEAIPYQPHYQLQRESLQI